MKASLKAIALTMSVLGTALTSFAQNAPKVNGQITQSGNKPVEFATVTLLKAKDSSLVKGAIADISGKYEFEQVKQGKYLVAAVAVGMTKRYSPVFEVGVTPVKVPAVSLEVVSKTLKGVDVSARKPFIEQKADKMVVNVESSITAAGGSAMEALEKSPTVTVDKDGNISMKGKSGVVIMIDGKPTNMTSQDVAELLRSMPATNLDQIELIANPSAKYDAAGNAGIINLKLKKNTNYGTNGNISLGAAQGIRPRWNGGLNLNHRNEKFNVFGSLNYSHREQQQDLGIYRAFTENGQNRVFDQVNGIHQKSNYKAGKIGADYFISKGHTIGVMADISGGDRNTPGNASTRIGNGKQVDSILKTNTIEKNNWNRNAFNLNYRGILDTTGRELNIDVDYAKNTEKQLANLYATSHDASEKGILASDTSRNNQPSTIDIKTAKIDYTHPLRNQAKFEAGAKVSFVKTDNDARFDSLRGGNWVLDENRSNHFIYKENVNAAYLNFSKQFKKVFVQVGLRGEQTNIQGTSTSTKNQEESKVKNDSSYFNLFPSMALTYKLNKSNTLGVTYSRRIQRPSYEDLNPFEFYLDRYTKQSGNPNLKPQYSNNFEITHTFKEFLITSIGYTHTKDLMTRVLEVEVDQSTGDTTILKHKYQNVAKANNFNLNVSVPMPITKWWMSFTTVSVSYASFETVVNNSTVKLSSPGFFARTQQTFTLSKDLSAEATFFFVSPQVTDEGLFRMKSLSSLDLGVSQKVLKGKGTLKLNITDVLKTNYFRGSFDNVGKYTSIYSKWDAQQVRLSFTYRFGNTNVKAARNRQTGLEAEQNRVKQGGN
ncbi:outer membrane beta-barrel family protein [Chitinophaga arvensicola]|uniref:Outer membrane receptor proteins, mostly Fe transport n=1 Tax=Chitinophaga arvensicola TaxID=29529 RepID=A0A1I0SAP3_9BACT|nr:outer membrane beta-barrel family protein [Chitinophaga arvensicola]SEW53562.1 Outer membrane receptor proteins, mostly Fe transport [Chitinophaga arvensicola]